MGALAAGPAGAAERPTVAVVPPFGVADDATARTLSGQLRRSIEGLDRFALLDVDRTRDELDAAEMFGLDCEGEDEGCLGRLAVALPVELLVVPTVREAGGRPTLELRLFDSATAARLNTVERVLAAPGGPERVRQVEELVRLLLVPEERVADERVPDERVPDERVPDEAAEGGEPGESPPAEEPPAEAPPPAVDEEPTPGKELSVAPLALLGLGAGLGALGAVMAVGGGALAGGMEVMLRQPDFKEAERAMFDNVGLVGLGVAAFGAMAVLGGGGLAAGGLVLELTE